MFNQKELFSRGAVAASVRRLLVMFVFLLTAVGLSLGPAGQEAAGQEVEYGDGEVVLRNTNPPRTSASQRSPEERAAAVPMDLLTVTGEPEPLATFFPPGPTVEISGNKPGTEAAPSNHLLAMEDSVVEHINGGAIWLSYPPPHTRYFPRFGNTLYPHRTLGKLFFDVGSGTATCSAAAVVCAGENDLVMTAGHCCSDGAGSFYSGFEFVPACVGVNCYSAPFGVWDWESVVVPTAWHTSHDYGRDVCYLKVQPNGAQELHQVVGSLGFAYNQTQPQHYHSTGWPSQAPFSGDRLVFEVAPTAELDGAMSPQTVGIGSLMTQGSSGGAWIMDYKQGSAATNQYWNGLNSYKYVSPNRPKEMFGPYIDTGINTIRTGNNVSCQ